METLKYTAKKSWLKKKVKTAGKSRKKTARVVKNSRRSSWEPKKLFFAGLFAR
jgi:hypothetical protein